MDERLTCDCCNKTYKTKKSLGSHLRKRINTEDDPYHCNMCDGTFLSKRGLTLHKKANHGGDKPFKCMNCKMRFCLKDELSTHKQSRCPKLRQMACEENTDDDRNHCNMCDRTFRSKGGLTLHMKTNHGGDKPFKCMKCKMRFRLQDELSTHKQSRCPKLRQMSCEENTDDDRNHCNMCDRTFRSKGGLTLHMKTNHGGDKPFKCMKCKMRFCLQDELSTHKQSSCPKVLKKTCEECGKQCKSSRDLKSHQTEVHLVTYPCSVCNRLWRTSEALERHMRKHAHCIVCNKVFETKSTLLQQ